MQFNKKWLMAKMEEQDLTQRELAQRAGVSPSSVHKALKGDPVATRIAHRIVWGLGLNLLQYAQEQNQEKAQ